MEIDGYFVKDSECKSGERFLVFHDEVQVGWVWYHLGELHVAATTPDGTIKFPFLIQSSATDYTDDTFHSSRDRRKQLKLAISAIMRYYGDTKATSLLVRSIMGGGESISLSREQLGLFGNI